MRIAAGIAIAAVLLAGGWVATARRERSAATTNAVVPPTTSVALHDSGAAGTASPFERRSVRDRTAPSRQKSQPDGAAAEHAQRKQTSLITVASEPYGVLFIDDIEIGDTPVANHPLEVGHSYRIRVEREGFRTKRETITVGSPNPIRRSYVLDPGGAQ